jgi:hypothetical protein
MPETISEMNATLISKWQVFFLGEKFEVVSKSPLSDAIIGDISRSSDRIIDLFTYGSMPMRSQRSIL